MFGAVIDDSIHLTVACGNEEKEKTDSSEISRSEAFKHRFGGERLAQVVDATQCVRTHRHRDALQEQRFTFFEKLANSVDKRKQRCREWYQFCYPHTN